MYNLICAKEKKSKYYSICNKSQMIKKKIKKSCIIASNESKLCLQQIADNLNKNIPRVKLTTLSTADSSAANFNTTLNISISNEISEIEKNICVPLNNNCDTEQCNTKFDFNLTNCGDTNNADNTKDAGCLIEDALSVDKNLNAVEVNNNNEMSDSSPTTELNATSLNIDMPNVIHEVEEGICFPSSNNCDTEQCNTKTDFSLTNCGDTSNGSHIPDVACLIEDLSIDKNLSAIEVNNNNEMSDKSVTHSRF